MRRIIIPITIAILIGILVYYKLTNISTHKIQGPWNVMNIYTPDKNNELFAMGFFPLNRDGDCSFPINALEPKSYQKGKWTKLRKNGNVYIAFSTENPFYNDTFLIAYFNITGPYSTMVLETKVKRILLRKFPGPIWGHPNPGNDWPKEYIEKKSREDESNKQSKDI